MTMGLTNAAATFQRAMDDMLSEFVDKFLVVYLDDNLIHSQTLKQHIDHVRQVTERMTLHNYKLNFKKCEFAQSEINFLGHLISYGKIRAISCD